MDQFVPDVSDPLSSPDQSPLLSQKQKPSINGRELKSPVKLQNGEVRRFKSSPSHSPSSSPRILGTRPSPSASESDDDEENRLLVLAKRRKLNYDTPNYTPSSRDSPVNLSQDESLLSPASVDDKTPNASQLEGLLSQFTNSTDTSAMSTPALSPSTSISSFPTLANQKSGANFRGRYKKDELWPAIQGDYQFLMDEEIIETCKSTESDLSWESDDVTNNATIVSFNEFLQQYNELTDWLTHIQSVTQRQSSSLSERYLNQTYHEEMLQRSPRRKLFNDYAKQLMRRYPDRKDEIQLRLQHLNKQWEALEKAISPHGGYMDEKTMLKDLEQDLDGLYKWLHEIEEHLQPLTLHPDWTTSQLHTQLQEHQVVQRDLEAHSKIVSAILKLCERLDSSEEGAKPEGATNKRLLASNLEHRWHVVLLQALEWQCCLEEAIKNGIKKRPVIDCPSSPESDDNQSVYTSYTSDQSTICRLNSTRDVNDDGVDSDNSNFDVIPFSESEYEKIVVDTDLQTDENLTDVDDRRAQHSASVTIPQREHHTEEHGEGVEHGGTDSALGRSVSDHSINAEQKTATYHCSIKLSHDKFRQALTKAVASRESLTMRAAQEPTNMPTGSPVRANPKPLSLRLENNDFGYSSESYSNEEPESQRHVEINGNIIQNQCRSVSADPENIQNANLRVSDVKPPESTWRHSMTSAYDTSSNCSDANNSNDDPEHHQHHRHQHHHRDDLIQNSLLEELVREDKVSALLSSPNQNFYQMTTIETDSEATSTAERQIIIEESRSGAATDADSELSKSLELPYDNTPVRYFTDSEQGNVSSRLTAKSRLDAVFERIEPLESPVGSPESPGQVVPQVRCPSDGDQSMDEDCSHHHLSDSGESNALFEMEGLQGCRNMEHPMASDHNTRLRFHDDSVAGVGSIGRLLQQASLLAKESTRVPTTIRSYNASVRKSRSGKYSEDAKSSLLSQSLTSTEGSMPNAQSTCEASSEGTSDSSESDEEFSSTSSASEAEDVPYDGSFEETLKGGDVLLTGLQGNNKSSDRHTSSVSEGQVSSLRHTRGKSTLLSSTSLCNYENLQYSVSEGAIDSLKAYHDQHKLRRATSALPLYPVPKHSTPRRVRRRRLHKGHSREYAAEFGVSPVKLMYSQSLPTSRVHSSRSHSRSLSPASLNVVCTGSETSPLKREEGDGDHLVPSVKVGTETDDDGVHQSLTSAAEFSENAWDNLHHIYSCISSDPGEEKLDASQFQNDWDFQNNCNAESLAPPVGEDKTPTMTLAASNDKSKSRIKEKRLNSSKLSTTQSYVDDSDSDLEDIHYVIEESCKAIKFTENTLKKFRKDNMETGIFIDPSEYDGPLETCKEHIVCLEEIRSVLMSKTGPETDLEEVQDISDMILKWESLWHLAGERQKQSKYLANIYEELLNIKSSLQAVTEQLEKSKFLSIHDLKKSIKLLQEHKMELHQHYQQNIPKLVERLTDFENLYPDLKMARFDEEIALIQCRLEASMDKVTHRASELQNILMSWYEFSETQRELEYLLTREKCQLNCLEGTEQIITRLFSLEDLNCTIHDLQALDTEMSHYERKLEALRSAQKEITKIHINEDLSQNIDELEKLFMLLRTRCRNMAGKIQKRLEKVDKQTQATLAMESAIDARLSQIAERDSLLAKSGRTSLLWRLMKIALPVQIAVVIGFCLLCLYDPAYCESINRFNLVFSPHLSYVDGPPPV